MAAVISSQHAGLWSRQTEASMHIADMHYTNMMPSYDTHRDVTRAPSSQSFQPTTTHMDMSMPLFSTNVLATSVPYQSGGFAFESLPVNPYNIQSTYPMSYPPNVSPVAYAGSPDPRPMPIAREARNAFGMDRNAVVKSESTSPVQPSLPFTNPSYGAECKRSSTEPAEHMDINFATDVDTLMKAIQAKQSRSSPVPDSPKVNLLLPSHISTDLFRQEMAPKVSQRPRKRYQCHMPNCNKSFYQKTHLEIHIRAHTGAKPFVSSERHGYWARANRLCRSAKRRDAANGSPSWATSR
jgi:hypothetical protein